MMKLVYIALGVAVLFILLLLAQIVLSYLLLSRLKQRESGPERGVSRLIKERSVSPDKLHVKEEEPEKEEKPLKRKSRFSSFRQ